MMACGVSARTEEERERLRAEGLIDGHAYSLLGAAQVVDSHGRTARIVKIRNPWGSFEWNGDWGDKSPLWSESAKEQMDYVDADDGTFHMPFDEFCSRFKLTFVSKYVDDYKFNAAQVPILDSGSYLFRVEVPEAGEYTFAASQKG